MGLRMFRRQLEFHANNQKNIETKRLILRQWREDDAEVFALINQDEKVIEFLQEVIELCPYKIHRILTDNGAQFTYALLAKNLRPQIVSPI